MHETREGMTVSQRILSDFGYFGHFLHQHAGGRAGKQHMLTHLLLSNGSLTQREIQEIAGTASASVSEVLTKLEGEGLIERTPLESDGRQREVRLTEAGKAKAQDLEARKIKFDREALAVLSTDEQAQLADLLDRVAAHWRDIENKEMMAAHE